MNNALLWERDGATWPHRSASRFVQAGRIRWHVQRMGAGPVLLMVHGMGASAHSWRDLLPILAERFDVITMDLPGHGFTDSVPAERYSLDAMSDAMHALLSTLSVQPLLCVGHSAGAAILVRMSLDTHIAPQSIVSINGAFLPFAGAAGVLFSPLAKLLASSSRLPRWLAQRAQDPAAVARLIENTGSRIDVTGVSLYARLVRDPKHVAGALGMMANWDLRALEQQLTQVPTPLTLVVAENDRTVAPAQAVRVQARLPQSELRTLPGLGHLAHEEQPARVAQIVIEVSQQCGLTLR